MTIDYDKADRELTLAKVAEAAGIARVEVLHGHTSMETAYVQPDYPYGRTLRCQRRVWLERAAKGSASGQYRLVTQTSNPKVPGLAWNKPHPSTYAYWAVLLKQPDNPHDVEDYLTWRGFGIWGPGPGEDVRFHVSGVYEQLTEDERKAYGVYLKLSHKGASSSWERWDSEIIPAVQAYHEEHGEYPAKTGDIRPYLPEHEFPAAVAAAILAPCNLS